MVRDWLVVVAAGESRRMGVVGPKVWQAVEGRPLLAWTIGRLETTWPWQGAVLVVRAADRERGAALVQASGLSPWTVVAGGSTRAASVRAGLAALREAGAKAGDRVLIHDGARPWPSAALVARVMERLEAGAEAVVPVLPVRDTVKAVDGDRVRSTIDREGLKLAQTPQGFRFGTIWAAHARLGDEAVTDDAAAAELAGVPVATVAGEADNRKVTVPEDWEWIRAVVAREGGAVARTGQGYDVHPLTAGGPLVLGGVAIPFESHLAGDSDGDVLTHAVIDAVLGAIGWGDLGAWFPPGDPRWHGADSTELLAQVVRALRQCGVVIQAVDATVVAARPRLRPWVPDMARRLGAVMGLGPGWVSIKATSTDGLGFEGRGEGIAALALATLQVPWPGAVSPPPAAEGS
ncbi:MAG: 2-C-methyl-D-erythritol 4-phosphate cytidylyltransferase [Firmicutes bacterium]|nr:2-C-methyl-D-erythritol 4-phosphate cytidylyltransferase [Alicyclobacillaceae bacterium]MCL6497932.1 2-C-methyl-D-erythritol 4-phosphate cytidylyltransferase [Bacillota bacterium]